MATPRKKTKDQLRAELDALIAQEKSDHQTRIITLGHFLFPPDIAMDGEPVRVLIDIAQLLPKQPVLALDKLIQIAQEKRDELAAKVTKKTAPKPSLKSVAEAR